MHDMMLMILRIMIVRDTPEVGTKNRIARAVGTARAVAAWGGERARSLSSWARRASGRYFPAVLCPKSSTETKAEALVST